MNIFLERKIKSRTIFLMFLIIFWLSNIVLANSKINIEIFKNDSCYSCYKEMQEVNKLLSKYKNLNIIYYNIEYNSEIFNEKMDKFNVPYEERRKSPIFIINNNKVILNKSGYRNELIKAIEENYKEIETVKGTPNKTFSIVSIFVAGLIDGINPCSIAILLFFISTVLLSKKKKEILKTAISYIAGTFICYLLLGFGLLNIAISINQSIIFYKILYIVTTLISLYLSYIYYQDYKYAQKGEINNIKSQLSSGMKGKIHKYIQVKNINKYIIISSFITGFIVSLFEFSCTGQIYLPSIMYMASIKNIDYKILLILYNIAFIIPLVFITYLIHKGTEIMEISSKLINNLKWIKLLGSIFFLIISVYLSYLIIFG